MKRLAYLFDMDGVLVDNYRFHELSWLEFAKRHGGKLTKEQILAWMGAPGRDYIVRMFDESVSSERISTLMEEKERLYREMFRPYLAPRTGLIRLLQDARQAGIPCAVVTGGSMANVDYVLDGTGIRGYFADIVDSSQYERGKPAPDCYLRGAAKLGFAPKDCIVFEDAVNGIASARAAGMRVVAVTGTNTYDVLAAAGADWIVDTFEEVPRQI